MKFVTALAPRGVRGAVWSANAAASRPSVPRRATVISVRWPTPGRRRAADAGLAAPPITTTTVIAATSADLRPDIRRLAVASLAIQREADGRQDQGGQHDQQ